jgi:diadenosine tetraphosphate (Ap4A) HIT family hydrolase
VLHPDKINLASFGNVVPHLHWHVIPRFEDDAHFPAPIWGKRKEEGGEAHSVPGLADALRVALSIE